MTYTQDRPPFAPWDEREVPSVLDPTEAARRAGIFGGSAKRLGELLDQWTSQQDGPAATVLARHARRFRWHTTVWEQLGGKPADAALDAVFEKLAGTSDNVERLAGAYRGLLPRMVAAHTYHMRALGTGATDDAGHWIGLILKDELDAVRDGELLLQSLLASDADVERAASARADIEAMFVEAGGLVGPGTLGGDAVREGSPR